VAVQLGETIGHVTIPDTTDGLEVLWALPTVEPAGCRYFVATGEHIGPGTRYPFREGCLIRLALPGSICLPSYRDLPELLNWAPTARHFVFRGERQYSLGDPATGDMFVSSEGTVLILGPDSFPQLVQDFLARQWSLGRRACFLTECPDNWSLMGVCPRLSALLVDHGAS
jgi:hypothetical protein